MVKPSGFCNKERVSRNSSDSEIITVALIASKYIYGNIDKAIAFVKSTQLMPRMLSKIRFNRRINFIFELIKGKQYRGYKPFMRKYFYGFTIQVIATVDGIPVEFAMLPGCYHDIDGMKNMNFNLPENNTLF